MSIQAQSADGVLHEFPDGTADDVVDRVMKNYAQQQQPGPMSWGDVGSQALSNIGPSALGVAQGIAQPFIHPIDTAKGVGNIAQGVLQKTGLESGEEHIPAANAVGTFFKDRYGGMENFKRTLAHDPVGFAADLSAVLSGGELAAARAPGVIGQAGRIAGTAGRLADPLMLPANVAKGAGNIGAAVSGTLTGAGTDAIKTAARAGYAGGSKAEDFLEHFNDTAPLRDVVDDARGAVQEMRRQRGDAYTKAMAKVGADRTPLDFDHIDNAISNAVRIKTYKGESLSPSTEGIRLDMTSAINKWKMLDPEEFHTVEGIDALKQKLGDMRDATQYGTPERKAANEIYGAVRQTIVDQAPDYAKVMKGYEMASDQIREIEGTLSLNPGARVDTALKKLQSALRDNVSTSYGYRRELAKYLVNAGAPNLMEKLAGQALKPWDPRGIARVVAGNAASAGIGAAFGHGALAAGPAAAALIPTLAASSPRLAGYGAYGIGAAGRHAMNAVDRLGPLGRMPVRRIGQVARPLGNPYSPPNPATP